ncbi:MAG TPA: putative molybdenum carrier protein [Alphaproteobacteria bacterium]|nr:putative molybdenum carrier protein [Alphaproteobacteria bacterium]
MRPLAGARTFSVVSGGQSGVDRAALDAALSLEIPVGGWCPKGRWAEDGPLSGRYPLRETGSPDPDVRTAANVCDSDATLVVIAAASDAGTDRTAEAAQRAAKPCLIVDLANERRALAEAVAWLAVVRPRVLNVVGPRESSAPGIYARTAPFLLDVLRHVVIDDDLHQCSGL